MTCPNCRSTATTQRKPRTTLGSWKFRFRTCGRRCNARTDTPFNDLPYPTDSVLLAVRGCQRYKLSFRDVAELLLQSGYAVTHETIRDWEFRVAPILAKRLRAKRRNRVGVSAYIDETDVKVAGRWCYRYRAIDRDGARIDSMLSEHRDKDAARRFLRRLVEVAERKPQRVITDKHPPYWRAICRNRGRKVVHRCHRYLNILIEPDHRAVKQRTYPMRGFGRFASAARFYAAFDELRQDFRVRRRRSAWVPLAEQRRLFVDHWRSLIAEMQAA